MLSYQTSKKRSEISKASELQSKLRDVQSGHASKEEHEEEEFRTPAESQRYVIEKPLIETAFHENCVRRERPTPASSDSPTTELSVKSRTMTVEIVCSLFNYHSAVC